MTTAASDPQIVPRPSASMPALLAADQGVADALEAVLSDNTRRVYGTQWELLTDWCDEVGLACRPAEPLTAGQRTGETCRGNLPGPADHGTPAGRSNDHGTGEGCIEAVPATIQPAFPSSRPVPGSGFPTFAAGSAPGTSPVLQTQKESG